MLEHLSINLETLLTKGIIIFHITKAFNLNIIFMGRILYIKSFLDKHTEIQIKLLKKIANEKGHECFFCYACDDLSEQLEFSHEKLLNTILENIDKKQVDAIVLHTGTAFYCFPSHILQVLSIVKYRFPRIKFIHEPIPNLDELKMKFKREYFRFDKKRENIHHELLFWLLDKNEIFEDQNEYYKIWKGN
jgi:hypothetical protein